jgi:hypothetical protein
MRIVVERHGRGDDEVRAFRALSSDLAIAGFANSIEKAGHAEIATVQMGSKGSRPINAKKWRAREESNLRPSGS